MWVLDVSRYIFKQKRALGVLPYLKTADIFPTRHKLPPFLHH